MPKRITSSRLFKTDLNPRRVFYRLHDAHSVGSIGGMNLSRTYYYLYQHLKKAINKKGVMITEKEKETLKKFMNEHRKYLYHQYRYYRPGTQQSLKKYHRKDIGLKTASQLKKEAKYLVGGYKPHDRQNVFSSSKNINNFLHYIRNKKQGLG